MRAAPGIRRTPGGTVVLRAAPCPHLRVRVLPGAARPRRALRVSRGAAGGRRDGDVASDEEGQADVQTARVPSEPRGAVRGHVPALRTALGARPSVSSGPQVPATPGSDAVTDAGSWA
ncbi:hypothetical protein GCM10017771_59190 [Streptomyces capitiformicae]|uniref:Uncharacterized protein n=1 Tax=Streptomyces capitiformicae TaxID=2014920 RepID=A0A918Z7L4_9ACTN|nr:hypothetical protein GCM10017771_59190 [Streptomyces capitiformicae]